MRLMRKSPRTNSGRLTFSLIDVAGNAAAETPTASLTVTRDQPPAIAITVPEKDALVVEGLTVPDRRRCHR